MSKTLEQAVAKVESLSADDQEVIGRQLLSHVEKLRQLRAEIDKGVRQLDAGEGQPLDIEQFVEEQLAEVRRRRAKDQPKLISLADARMRFHGFGV